MLLSLRSVVAPATLLLAAALPLAVTACSAGEDQSTSESQDEIRARGGLEGDACNDFTKCMSGLECKPREPGSSSGGIGGPPPGAVGMPLPPGQGTCEKPAGPGEQGAECSWDEPCNPGLVCQYDGGGSSSGGPPPGAVGLPILPDDQESSGPPPGAVGMPLPQKGTCQPDNSSSSGGPPPGAVGLPIQPND